MGKKGSNFERQTCKQLSLWWTDGKDDDVFWRSQTSGARATTRRKQGKRTSGNYGDIAVTDPIGTPLLDLVTIELKRGYNKWTLHDLLDRPRSAAQQKLEEWIEQALDAWLESGSFSWLLIVKRDQREPYVVMPYFLYEAMGIEFRPYWFIRQNIRTTNEVLKAELVVTTLKQFLKTVTPAHIRRLVMEV